MCHVLTLFLRQNCGPEKMHARKEEKQIRRKINWKEN